MHFSVEELARILLTNSVPEQKLCTKQPVRVCHNATFVVDLNSLDHHQDIRANENGVWIWKGSPVAYVSVHTKDCQTNIFRRTNMGNHPNHLENDTNLLSSFYLSRFLTYYYYSLWYVFIHIHVHILYHIYPPVLSQHAQAMSPQTSFTIVI